MRCDSTWNKNPHKPEGWTDPYINIMEMRSACIHPNHIWPEQLHKVSLFFHAHLMAFSDPRRAVAVGTVLFGLRGAGMRIATNDMVYSSAMKIWACLVGHCPMEPTLPVTVPHSSCSRRVASSATASAKWIGGNLGKKACRSACRER